MDVDAFEAFHMKRKKSDEDAVFFHTRGRWFHSEGLVHITWQWVSDSRVMSCNRLWRISSSGIGRHGFCSWFQNVPSGLFTSWISGKKKPNNRWCWAPGWGLHISRLLNASRRWSCDAERAPGDELKPSDTWYTGMQGLSGRSAFDVGASALQAALGSSSSVAAPQTASDTAFQNHTAKSDPTVNTPQTHWLSSGPSGLRFFFFFSVLVMAVWKSDC